MKMELTERQKEALNMGRSVCVTAGAGTGKTFLLSKRYVSCLIHGAEPKDVLALTYTDKAAAEMRVKIEKDIRANSGTLPELEKALDGFARCTISTFHGFSASLIREFATEAGVDPGFSVMDELDKYELILSTIKEMLDEPPAELYADVVTLFHYAAARTIRNYILYLLPKWHEAAGWFSRLEARPDTVIADWQREWARVVLPLNTEFVSSPEVRHAINDYNAAEGKCELFKEAPRLFRILQEADDCKAISEAGKKMAALDARGFNKKSIDKDCHKVFMTLRDCYKQYPEYPSADDQRTQITIELLTALGRVTARIYSVITAEKQQKGILDFDDLIYHASRLIQNEAIQEELNRRYRFILVDEVQDNDPVLTEIVNILCGDPKLSRKLFVVGDVKQSIYRFRGAEVQGFITLMGRFLQEPVNLDTCFRSVPEITGFVNAIFTNVFDERTGQDPKYENIISGRPEGEAGSVALLRCRFKEKIAVGPRCSEEAKYLASWILTKLQDDSFLVYDGESRRHTVPGDFAILMDKRTHIAELETALKSYGIRYREYKGRSFYQKQEVYDFSNLLKAVLYPEDPVPFYGALRSPYFGLSDSELCTAGRFCEGRSFAEKFAAYAEKAGGRAKEAADLLNRWRAEAAQKPLTAFLRGIIYESGILSVYGGLTHGPEMTANLEKLVDIARSKEAAGAFSLSRFLDILDVCIEEGIDEGEGETDEGDADCVKILTVHASKGLEYPVTILAFSGEQHTIRSDSITFDKRFGAGISVTLPGDKNGRSKSLVLSLVRDEQEMKERAERKRLFYVAATRARDHLLICGSESPKSKDSAVVAGEGSFLEMCEAAAGDMPLNEEEPVILPIPEPPARAVRADGEYQPTIFADEEAEPTMFSRLSVPEQKIVREGSCLHEIFAGGNAHEVCRRYGLEEKERQFTDEREVFLSSELMKDVVQSWCELPVVTESGEARIIDRLMKRADGSFAIIDYKSGKEKEQSRERMDAYRAQLGEYADIVSGILGSEVPALLYFVGSRSVVRVR